jgi:nitroreductase
MDRLQIKKSILLSQKCQRNYDLTREIPQEDLDLLETALSQCPSKQNLCFYDAHMITDRKIIEKIHEHTAGIRARAVDPNDTVTNPQMMGNLCVVFTEPRKKPLESQTINPRNGKEYGFRNLEQRLLAGTEEEAASFHGRTREMVKEHLRSDQQVALGIAAGYVNLVAAQLGYRSGCTNCFHAEPIMEILGIEERPLLIMGIGFNNPERDRREHQLDPEFMFPTHAKMPIGVTWHKK